MLLLKVIFSYFNFFILLTSFLYIGVLYFDLIEQVILVQLNLIQKSSNINYYNQDPLDMILNKLVLIGLQQTLSTHSLDYFLSYKLNPPLELYHQTLEAPDQFYLALSKNCDSLPTDVSHHLLLRNNRM